MNWLLIFAFIVFGIGISIRYKADCADSSKIEIINNDSRVDSKTTIRKLHYDGHTYIYLINKWNYAGNQLLHDPGCECLNKKEQKQQKTGSVDTETR